MRASLRTPTADPLPYVSESRGTRNQNGIGNPPITGPGPEGHGPALPALRGEAIARFDALLHEINPDAVRVDPDRLQQLMIWLTGLTPTRLHHVLDRRLRRVEELRAMVEDFDWDTDESTRVRLARLVDYIDRDDDLIADQQPVFGMLDDILLIELAWPAFATEADEYRDFCAYRNDEHPDENGDRQRASWVRDRAAEVALWRHHLQVDRSHYAESGEPGPRFRVT
ncbi:MAG TPA: hypothetical protein VFS82_10135 [Lysobacter sp.]|nr:hypothetical protein [Lysobacter sp.]